MRQKKWVVTIHPTPVVSAEEAPPQRVRPLPDPWPLVVRGLERPAWATAPEFDSYLESAGRRGARCSGSRGAVQ